MLFREMEARDEGEERNGLQQIEVGSATSHTQQPWSASSQTLETQLVTWEARKTGRNGIPGRLQEGEARESNR
jgi:hypothetical protein